MYISIYLYKISVIAQITLYQQAFLSMINYWLVEMWR